LRESQVPRSLLLRGVLEILPKEIEKLMHTSVVEIFLSATLRLAGLYIFPGRSHYNAVWMFMGKVSYSYVWSPLRIITFLRSVQLFWTLVPALVNETIVD